MPLVNSNFVYKADGMGIDGIWYNELGSELKLVIDGQNQINGGYSSNVGPTGVYPLVGLYDPTPAAGQNCGCVVDWNSGAHPSASLTAWSGQYWPTDGDLLETIIAMWHVTLETGEAQQWASTLDGKDIFVLNKPSSSEIEVARKRSAPSHPHRD